MARQFVNSYTSGHVVHDDGSVEFDCSVDREKWAWLALPPRHPIVVQAQNFWTSVGAILALGGMEEGQWSALTWTDWKCGEKDAEHAARGRYWREKDGEHESFAVDLFDIEDRKIVHMRGRGVVFRNRNFEQWRGEAKRKAAEAPEIDPFEFADRDALGIGPGEHPLVGFSDEAETILALVSRENGLPPANPMLGGSGDHVNSVHMIEAARQALCLITGNPAPEITGGEMSLNRYVELGTQFRLAVSERDASATTFTLEQLSKDCAEITLRF